MRNFEEWLATFTDNINDWGYYISFDNVKKNTEPFIKELALLNTLRLSQDIDAAFTELIEEYPKVLKAIPLLLAVRGDTISITDEDRRFDFNFKNPNYDSALYCEFMHKTGLFDLLQNQVLESLVDVGTGINIGLDSNARKNRGGHLMENLVEFYIKEAGFIKDETYFKEMYLEEVEKRWGYDLSAISAEGTTTKRFDFVVKPAGSSEVYICECNCYSSSGSKLNETARSFKQISIEASGIEHVHFVWFTDGAGWIKTKRNLKETYDVNDNIYNINDIKNGIMSNVFI